MEVFVDFGLFELIAAAGLAFISRKIYARRWLGLMFLGLSLAAPAVLVFVGHEGPARWVAVVCLATSLVNAALIFSIIQRRAMATLFLDQQVSQPIKGSN